MSKKILSQKETKVANSNGVGNQLEQTFTEDDICLPSPKELAEYKQIDPRIVDFLIEASNREQGHRHQMDAEKMKIIDKSDRRIGRTNWWGMFFAFLSIIAFVALTAFALYLDKPWFAGMAGFSCLVTVVSIFVRK